MTADNQPEGTPIDEVTITEYADGDVVDSTSSDTSEAAAAKAEVAGEGNTPRGAETDPEAGPEAQPEPEEPTAEDQIAELTDDLQRLNAEYANFRKRVERDRAQEKAAAKAAVIQQLLPILDDLALAAQHGDLSGALKSVDDKLRGILANAGVEAFGAQGDAYDFALHEAVQDGSTGDEKVLGQVLRQGYRMGDRVLRTAMVIVADPS